MAYEEVSYERTRGSSPLGKICGSLCCSFVGLLLFFGSLAGTVHNERSTVCIARSLEAARQAHFDIGCDFDVEAAGGPSDNPVFFSCPIEQQSYATWGPEDFGADWLTGSFHVQAVTAKQRVEMFQCEEKKQTTERKLSNGVTERVDRYSYHTLWSERPVDSSRFKGFDNHDARLEMESGCGRGFTGNPAFPLTSQTLSSGVLSVGGYDLSRHLSTLRVDTPINLQKGAYRLPGSSAGSSRTSGTGRRTARDGQQYTRQEFTEYYGQEKGLDMWDEAGQTETRQGGGEEARVKGHMVQTCASPEMGCLRISYYRSDGSHASHIATLKRGRVGETRPWEAPGSWLCSSKGTSNQVDLFQEGSMSAATVITMAEDNNSMMTWLLRAACMLGAACGFMCFLQPIQAVANMVDSFLDYFQGLPLLGSVLDFLGDVVSGAACTLIVVISFGVAVPSTLAVIGLMWMVMKPMQAVPLLAVCYALFKATVNLMQAHRAEGHAKRGSNAKHE